MLWASASEKSRPSTAPATASAADGGESSSIGASHGSSSLKTACQRDRIHLQAAAKETTSAHRFASVARIVCQRDSRCWQTGAKKGGQRLPIKDKHLWQVAERERPPAHRAWAKNRAGRGQTDVGRSMELVDLRELGGGKLTVFERLMKLHLSSKARDWTLHGATAPSAVLSNVGVWTIFYFDIGQL